MPQLKYLKDTDTTNARMLDLDSYYTRLMLSAYPLHVGGRTLATDMPSSEYRKHSKLKKSASLKRKKPTSPSKLQKFLTVKKRRNDITKFESSQRSYNFRNSHSTNPAYENAVSNFRLAAKDSDQNQKRSGSVGAEDPSIKCTFCGAFNPYEGSTRACFSCGLKSSEQRPHTSFTLRSQDELEVIAILSRTEILPINQVSSAKDTPPPDSCLRDRRLRSSVSKPRRVTKPPSKYAEESSPDSDFEEDVSKDCNFEKQDSRMKEHQRIEPSIRSVESQECSLVVPVILVESIEPDFEEEVSKECNVEQRDSKTRGHQGMTSRLKTKHGLNSTIVKRNMPNVQYDKKVVSCQTQKEYKKKFANESDDTDEAASVREKTSSPQYITKPGNRTRSEWNKCITKHAKSSVPNDKNSVICQTQKDCHKSLANKSEDSDAVSVKEASATQLNPKSGNKTRPCRNRNNTKKTMSYVENPVKVHLVSCQTPAEKFQKSANDLPSISKNIILKEVENATSNCTQKEHHKSVPGNETKMSENASLQNKILVFNNESTISKQLESSEQIISKDTNANKTTTTKNTVAHNQKRKYEKLSRKTGKSQVAVIPNSQEQREISAHHEANKKPTDIKKKNAQPVKSVSGIFSTKKVMQNMLKNQLTIPERRGNSYDINPSRTAQTVTTSSELVETSGDVDKLPELNQESETVSKGNDEKHPTPKHSQLIENKICKDKSDLSLVSSELIKESEGVDKLPAHNQEKETVSKQDDKEHPTPKCSQLIQNKHSKHTFELSLLCLELSETSGHVDKLPVHDQVNQTVSKRNAEDNLTPKSSRLIRNKQSKCKSDSSLVTSICNEKSEDFSKLLTHNQGNKAVSNKDYLEHPNKSDSSLVTLLLVETSEDVGKMLTHYQKNKTVNNNSDQEHPTPKCSQLVEKKLSKPKSDLSLLPSELSETGDVDKLPEHNLQNKAVSNKNDQEHSIPKRSRLIQKNNSKLKSDSSLVPSEHLKMSGNVDMLPVHNKENKTVSKGNEEEHPTSKHSPLIQNKSRNKSDLSLLSSKLAETSGDVDKLPVHNQENKTFSEENGEEHPTQKHSQLIQNKHSRHKSDLNSLSTELDETSGDVDKLPSCEQRNKMRDDQENPKPGRPRRMIIKRRHDFDEDNRVLPKSEECKKHRLSSKKVLNVAKDTATESEMVQIDSIVRSLLKDTGFLLRRFGEDNSNYKCPKCSKVFGNPKFGSVHYSICSKIIQSAKNKKVLVSSRDIVWTCSLCHSTFDELSKLSEHKEGCLLPMSSNFSLKIASSRKKLKCKKCCYECLSEITLKDHPCDKNIEKMRLCAIKIPTLDITQSSTSNLQYFECTRCCKIFFNVNSFKVHMQTIHNINAHATGSLKNLTVYNAFCPPTVQIKIENISLEDEEYGSGDLPSSGNATFNTSTPRTDSLPTPQNLPSQTPFIENQQTCGTNREARLRNIQTSGSVRMSSNRPNVAKFQSSPRTNSDATMDLQGLEYFFPSIKECKCRGWPTADEDIKPCVSCLNKTVVKQELNMSSNSEEEGCAEDDLDIDESLANVNLDLGLRFVNDNRAQSPLVRDVLPIPTPPSSRENRSSGSDDNHSNAQSYSSQESAHERNLCPLVDNGCNSRRPGDINRVARPSGDIDCIAIPSGGIEKEPSSNIDSMAELSFGDNCRAQPLNDMTCNAELSSGLDCNTGLSNNINCDAVSSSLIDCNKTILASIDRNAQPSGNITCNVKLSAGSSCNSRPYCDIPCNPGPSNAIYCNKTQSADNCNKPQSVGIDCNKPQSTGISCNETQVVGINCSEIPSDGLNYEAKTSADCHYNSLDYDCNAKSTDDCSSGPPPTTSHDDGLMDLDCPQLVELVTFNKKKTSQKEFLNIISKNLSVLTKILTAQKEVPDHLNKSMSIDKEPGLVSIEPRSVMEESSSQKAVPMPVDKEVRTVSGEPWPMKKDSSSQKTGMPTKEVHSPGEHRPMVEKSSAQNAVHMSVHKTHKPGSGEPKSMTQNPAHELRTELPTVRRSYFKWGPLEADAFAVVRSLDDKNVLRYICRHCMMEFKLDSLNDHLCSVYGKPANVEIKVHYVRDDD